MHRRCDRQVVAGALAHGLVTAGLLALAVRSPALPLPARGGMVLLLALGVYWGSNTVSHIHLHTPLWRSGALNRLFSLGLTLSLAVPQRLWQRRHLRHHGLPDPQVGRLGGWGWIELALLGLAAGTLALMAPTAFLGAWLPGWALGLAFCAVAGHGEHAGAAAGVDHRGRLYNRLCFNDGYHAAHHRSPARHWAELPADTLPADVPSAWPPLLRWLEALARGANLLAAGLLDRCERMALRAAPLRRLLLATHEPALRELLARLGPAPVEEVLVVGGGLFPRTALLLGQLLPRARLILLDVSQPNLATAAAWLPPALRARTTLRCGRFDPARPLACDLLVVPLAFRGDRRQLYLRPPAPALLVHDWLWRRAPTAARPSTHSTSSRVVSWWLLKRLSLVKACFPAPAITGNLEAGVPGATSTLFARRPPCQPVTPSPLEESPSCSLPACSTVSVPATPRLS